VQTPGTQVVPRKKLAGSGAPPYVAEAEALLEKREFAAALAVLEQGAKDGPKPIEALLAFAEAHWELVHPKESIDFLKEAIQKAPKDARPFAQLGRYLLYKGLRDQAMNFLDRAIALDPNDPETKKLRERAALNKKKAYTVVANAADFTAALGEKKPQGATRMHKKEATRFLSVDPAKAAEELAKAESGAAEEMDRALAALLGADLLGVDAKLLKPEAATSSAGGTVRTVIAFVVVALSGLLVGGLAFHFGPKGGVDPDDVPALVARDTLTSLRRAVDLTAGAEDASQNGVAALAHALLLVEHGGDLGMLERAEQLLGADAAQKKSPAGLYARALIKRHPRAETDADLDDDLAKASAPGDPWTLLAFAARAEDT
jgi:tetratricopeptide (TPR) repeat protein